MKKTAFQQRFLLVLFIMMNFFFSLPGFLLPYSSGQGKRAFPGLEKPLAGQISISGAWALYPLAARWAEEFQKENPSIKIDLQAGGAGKGMADVLSGLVDLGMVSREIYPEEIARGALPLAVARDAVVATLNKKNPILKLIEQRGFTREIFRAIWIEGRINYWEEIFGQPGKTPIHLYTRSDACGAAETWAAFLGAHQEDLKGIGIYGDPGL
ncbi:MAG: substrate-binding domain-containing protein, partial [Acidobacteriota bacterium]|nr:substrate-binding domain-containing protein [Acidobacteriota bacterium]